MIERILWGMPARCGKTVRMQHELEKAKAAGKKVIVVDKEQFYKKHSGVSDV